MKSYWPLNVGSLSTQQRCYIVSGIEDLLLEQSYQQIIKFAKKNGFNEHHRLYGSEDLNTSKLDQLIINKGLFSQGTIIDIRLPEGKTGRSGAGVLLETIDKIQKHTHTFLLISANNLSKKLSAKWVDKLEQVGMHIQHPLLNERKKRDWLRQRLQQANISIEQKAQDFLLVLTEGNLLALEQQIRQLEIATIEEITLQQLHKRFQDEARFNLYALPEKIFSGKATKALRMCRRLRQEGEPLVLICWSIINELSLGIQVAELQRNRQSSTTFFKSKRIWPERQKVLNTVAQYGLDHLLQKIQHLHLIDKQSKGQASGDGWLSLEQFISLWEIYEKKQS